ncbi:MAG TPA: methylmalonyl-CoA mutase family protein [Thermodesulfobacteriota bacterium]|nr:methylmalonyl-CoA mutase family protein [Thermodesulfobacteriota bacterium]
MSRSNSNDKGVNLFEEFPPVSTEEWKATIEKDIKGASFEKLVWKPYESFTVKPFYRVEDLESLDFLINELPGELPYMRGARTNNDWQICEDVHETDIRRANRIARDGIGRGGTSLSFVCEVEDDRINGIPVQGQHDMALLLEGIPLEEVLVHFRCGRGASAILSMFINEARERGVRLDTLRGSVDADPINYLELNGSFYTNQRDSFGEVRSIIHYLNQHMPDFRGLKVHGHAFHDSGASIVQELAFTLASGVEYLDQLTSMDLTSDQIAQHMLFSFSIGSNYFLEIAKLRAARLLWAQIVEQFNPKEEKSMAMAIDARTSSWNKTVYDPYVNMIRGTVEAMAAAIGGCDGLTVVPFDATYKSSGEFSRRIARNTQIILKSESYLDKVIDPAAGSYYIENLTDMIARETWSLFQSVEEEGGIVEALKSGFVQGEIEKTRQKKDMNIAARKDIFLGTNQYPNLEEEISSQIEEGRTSSPLKRSGGIRVKDNSIESFLDLFSKKGALVGDIISGESTPEFEIKPLKPYRGAQAFEELRLATEKYRERTGKTPKVFLLAIGDLSMRKARASFSYNFFGSAGFEIIESLGFDRVEEGVKAALDSGAQIVVICSSDKEYAELAPIISKKLKQENPDVFLIIAGYPKGIIDEMRKAGVDDFIYRETNTVETVKKYQKLLGISTQ